MTFNKTFPVDVFVDASIMGSLLTLTKMLPIEVTAVTFAAGKLN